MDPWVTNPSSLITRSQTFEDNFIPPPSSPTFQKLPDSEEYLASLEKKLNKVQSKAVSSRDKSKEILRSLEENRDSCMLNLLSGSVSLQEPSGEDLKVNPLLKRIQPEKQALSTEELTHLVKADQLSEETTNPDGGEEHEDPVTKDNEASESNSAA